MDDLISRQEAIDALNEYFVRIGKLKRRGLNKGEKAISLDTVGSIKSLPPANCSEFPNNSDTISRQAAIDAAREELESGTYFDIPSKIEDLPSAQPERKRGKWTKENACEFCGFQPWFERDIHTLSFCPNCGADMREEQYG